MREKNEKKDWRPNEKRELKEKRKSKGKETFKISTPISLPETKKSKEVNERVSLAPNAGVIDENGIKKEKGSG